MGINQLITKDDNMHIHKTLGIFVLFHYIIQYSLYFIYGDVYLYTWNIFPHIALHLSSFIFDVLEKRIISKSMSMFIWEELRLHSLIFATRGCLCILFPDFRLPIVFLTMFMADYVTALYGTPNHSTVRGNHEYQTNSMIKLIFSNFFSISQLGATIICGGFFHNSSVLIFATLPPIQTSAFGMTLIRKNLMSKFTWQVIYSIELLSVYIIWYMETNNLLIIPMSITAYIMRRANISKYSLFLTLVFVKYFFDNLPYMIMDINDNFS